MGITAILAALFLFGTVLFLLLGITVGGPGKGVAAARARLEGFKRGSTEGDVQVAPPTFAARVLTPSLHRAVDLLRSLLPTSMLKGVERQLIIAGEPMTMSGFLTMVLVASGAAAA